MQFTTVFVACICVVLHAAAAVLDFILLLIYLIKCINDISLQWLH